MVSGDKEDWNPFIGYRTQRRKNPGNDRSWYAAPVKKITAMEHGIHIPLQGRFQCHMVISEKFLTPSPPLDTWVQGQIEAEMTV